MIPEGRFTFALVLLPPLFDAQALLIPETPLFVSGFENFFDNKQIREGDQAWMVGLQ